MPPARCRSSVVVPATPFLNIRSAAMVRIRCRVARPLGVKRCGCFASIAAVYAENWSNQSIFRQLPRPPRVPPSRGRPFRIFERELRPGRKPIAGLTRPILREQLLRVTSKLQNGVFGGQYRMGVLVILVTTGSHPL